MIAKMCTKTIGGHSASVGGQTWSISSND